MKAEIKPYYDETRTELNKMVPLDTPFTVFIQPSTICNIKCNYCLHSLSENEKNIKKFDSRLMDLKLFNLILQQIKQFPRAVKDISFTGMGEPLCNKKLPQMIKMTKESNVALRTQFFTNALLLSRETSLALIGAGLDELRISLQGINSKKYYDICGAKIDFNELVENIRFFYENKKNCKLYIKVADIALEEGEGEIFFSVFQDICDKIFIEHIVPLFEGINYSKIIKTTAKVNKYGEDCECYAACPNSFYTLNIYPNGDVHPCCSFIDTPLGNVKNESLVEIWNSNKREEFLMMQLRGERFDYPACRNCFVPYNQQPEDNLDKYAKEIIDRIQNKEKKTS